MRLVSIPVFAPILFALACGGTTPASSTTPTGPSAPPASHPVPALSGVVTCHGGKGDLEFATGREEGGLEFYLRRGWDAATNTLTEDSVTVMKGNVSRNWTTSQVSGTDLTVSGKYATGTFAGTGKGTAGDAPFTAWTVDLKMADGGATVHSEYQLGATLGFSSIVSDPKGNAIMKFSGALPALDDAACQAAFSRFAPL